MLAYHKTISTKSTGKGAYSSSSPVGRKGYEKKHKHYSRLVSDRTWGTATIVPVAFSSLGRPEARGIEAFRQVAKSLAGNNTAQYAMILRRICQVTSVAIWRGNSGLIRAYSRMIETAQKRNAQEEEAARRRNGHGPNPPAVPPQTQPAEASDAPPRRDDAGSDAPPRRGPSPSPGN